MLKYPTEDGEDISGVEADPSELMGHEKPPPTLRFGPSLATEAEIASYIAKGYFGPGVCRHPEGEETLEPCEGECVVFRDFYVAAFAFRWILLF